MDQDLLQWLVCPKCKGGVELDQDEKLLCETCSVRYPVRDGLPVMLIDEAEKVELATS
nr:Trm112 family protein [uncultured Desulfuromonas sp.]